MKRGIIGIGLVLGVLVVVGLVLRARARQDRNPEDLQTVQVERGMVQLSVSADGVLQPLTTVAVKSYAGGSIDLLDVEVGDEVEEGGLIAKIDPTDSRTAYDQAVADLTAARARLTQAREQAARQPALTRAGIAQAEASHRSALKDLERLEQATQPQTRVQARATLDKAKANLAIAEREPETLEKVTQPQDRAQARATLDKATANLSTAEKELETLEKVTQPQDRAQAHAALDKAKANLDMAEKELSRVQGLRDLGFVPQSELDVAINRRDLAEAELEVAQQRWGTLEMDEKQQMQAAVRRRDSAKADLAVAQQRWDTLDMDQNQQMQAAVRRRDSAKADLATAQERWNRLEAEQSAEVEGAQARVQQAKAGLDRAEADAVQDRLREADVQSAQAQVARAQAQADNARTMLEYTTVRAPRSGVILKKFVEQGTIVTSGRSTVAQGTDIVELGDLSKMFVEVNLDEADVGHVSVGLPVQIQVDAFADEAMQGVASRIDPQAATEQNITTVLVTVEIENPDARLKPGMTASCDFLVEQVEDTLYLPNRAVRDAGDRYVVSVIGDNGEPVETEVEIGVVGDEHTEVLEGLREGTEVVLPGLLGGPRDIADRMREHGQRAGGMGGFIKR